MQSQKNLDDFLSKIQAQYIQSIDEKLRRLATLIAEVKTSRSKDSLNNLKGEIHKIAGSSGSYGFNEVSTICKKIELDLVNKIQHLEKCPIDTEWLSKLDDEFLRIREGFKIQKRPSESKQSQTLTTGFHLNEIEQLYRHSIPDKIATIKNLIQQINENPKRENFKALRQFVHKIAGSAGSYGFSEASELCKQLEVTIIDYLQATSQTTSTVEWSKLLEEFYDKLQSLFKISNQESSKEDSLPSHLSKALLYIVAPDEDLLNLIEKEKTDFELNVITETDPQKALYKLSDPQFIPNVLIVSDSFPTYPTVSEKLIELFKRKQLSIPTCIGIIINDDKVDTRILSLNKGANYIFTKPLSAKKLLSNLKDISCIFDIKNFKVLIVDDDPDIGNLLTLWLNESGISSQCISNEGSLFEALQAFQPQLLMLDLALPNYDGLSLLKALRADPNYQHLIIVIMTARQDLITLEQAYTAGADEILFKPLDKKALQARLLSFLKKSNLYEQHTDIDKLTGISNQNSLISAIQIRLQPDASFSIDQFLAIFQIDQFENIASILGQKETERLLVYISNLLPPLNKNHYLNAYLGEGKFGILYEDLPSSTVKMHIYDFLKQLTIDLRATNQFSNQFSFSCGLIRFSSRMNTAKDVIDTAEKALVLAKQQPHQGIRICDSAHLLPQEQSGKEALIIDDDPDLVKLLRHVCEAQGFIVHACDTGQGALDYLKNRQDTSKLPLIILDRLLPDMDGIEVFKQLRQQYSHKIPVIILSALSSEQDMLQGLKEGPLDYIPKPFNISIFTQKLQNLNY